MDVLSNADTVELYITNSKNKDQSCLNLKKFKLDITVAELKMKLEILTGQLASSMDITLCNSKHEPIAILNNNNALLSDYNVQNEMTLFVEGPSLTDGIENGGNDFKYVLPEEKYKERKESLQKFIKKQKEQRQKLEEQLNDSNEVKNKTVEENVLKDVEVGKRCKLTDSTMHVGTVMFVGETQFAPGTWIGIKLDEPYGKNNGTVKDVKYFECENNYGMFVKPGRIIIGDFPVQDPFDDEEI